MIFDIFIEIGTFDARRNAGNFREFKEIAVLC